MWVVEGLYLIQLPGATCALLDTCIPPKPKVIASEEEVCVIYR